MADNEWVNIFAAGAPAPGSLRDALLRSTELVIPAAATVATTSLAGCRALKVAGVSYFYDSTDTTSAHDGVSVLVSADGRRYKIGQPQFVPNRVESYTDTPAGSPALGEAYLVGAAPSGAWSAHADEIAIYTANGWAFIDPDNIAGSILYVADEDASYQFADSGWRKGLGASAVGDEAIRPEHLSEAISRSFAVENQTTNAPPGSPTANSVYVIGPSPTGDWAGNQGRIAVRNGTAWDIFTPAEGWRVWDKSLDAEYIFNGTAWVSPLNAAQAISRVASAYVTNAGLLAVTGAGNGSGATNLYAYSDGTAPTTSQRRISYNFLDLTFAATASGKKIVFEWDGVDLASFDQSAHTITIAVFRDAETSAMLWCNGNKFNRLFALSADSVAHVYRLCVMVIETVGSTKATLKNMSFSIKEFAA